MSRERTKIAVATLIATTILIQPRATAVFAQDIVAGSGQADPVSSIDRTDLVASGVGRVGQNGIGIVDTNPNRDTIGGGVPCGLNNTCDLPASGGPAAGGGSVAAAPAAGSGPAAGSPAAPPPPPPTHVEIVASICPAIPQPEVGYNPPYGGVTGFETWLWDDSQPGSQTAAGSIRGYGATCTITPTRWTFDVGEPTAERYGQQQVYTATESGAEADDTPVQHVWSTKGTYAIQLTVNWTRASSAGADVAARTVVRPTRVREIVVQPTSPDALD